jgi:uncharacterized caspase-like protein
LARAMGTRSSAIGRGLAQVEAGGGTLISYSTQPGNVALDGTGRNSPFAGALVKHIVAPGVDVGALLIRAAGLSSNRRATAERSSGGVGQNQGH